MCSSIIWTIFIIFLIVIIYKVITPPARLKKYGDKIPGPKSYPIIGNGIFFFNFPTIIQALFHIKSRYGPVSRLWLGKCLFVVLSDPNDIEVFLSNTKNLNKSDSYKFLEPWLGKTNLLTSEADIWQIHRKLLTPSFHFKILENSLENILKNAQILCENLEKHVNQAEFDVNTLIEKCTLDIICEMAMGIKLETQLSKNTEYLDAVKSASSITIKRIYFPWLQPSLLFNISKFGQLYKRNLKIIKSQGCKVINERKISLLENKENYDENLDRKSRKHLTFLDFLLLESNFSDTEIEDEVQTFMFAGHDTTTAAISFCLYELSNNQNVQDKLVNELKDILLHKEDKLNYHDFFDMKYMDCVIKESLRINSVVPVISRNITQEVNLLSGYTLPVGSLVNFDVYHMHRDEILFPEPNKFSPERFQTRDENHNPYTYIPFSAGSRNCIGQKFAMIEIKAIISTILSKFQILPQSKVEPRIMDTGLVLRSLNGLPIRIKRRDLKQHLSKSRNY